MWRPIWERMALLCDDVLNKELLSSGWLTTTVWARRIRRPATRLPSRLEEWLAEETGEEFSLVTTRVPFGLHSEGRLVSDEELGAEPNAQNQVAVFSQSGGTSKNSLSSSDPAAGFACGSFRAALPLRGRAAFLTVVPYSAAKSLK